jgi:hypothetical protein
VRSTLQVLKQLAYIVIVQTGPVAHVLRLDAEGFSCLRGVGCELGTKSAPNQVVERLTKWNTSSPAKSASAFQNVFVQSDSSSDAHDATILAS